MVGLCHRVDLSAGESQFGRVCLPSKKARKLAEKKAEVVSQNVRVTKAAGDR